MAMVDVSKKELVHRTAVARGKLVLSHAGLEAMRSGHVEKGDPMHTAEAAAMLAVKSLPQTIPHCHPVPVSSVNIEFELEDDGIVCTCSVSAIYRTGVEMEALMGASVAMLTLWDMVKYVEKDDSGQYPHTSITDLRVVLKKKEDAYGA